MVRWCPAVGCPASSVATVRRDDRAHVARGMASVGLAGREVAVDAAALGRSAAPGADRACACHRSRAPRPRRADGRVDAASQRALADTVERLADGGVTISTSPTSWGRWRTCHTGGRAARRAVAYDGPVSGAPEHGDDHHHHPCPRRREVRDGLSTVEILQYDFMVRALVAAVLVGATAPTVGVHLVQRRLALIGDGLGHVALAGVAIGVLTESTPVLTALVVAVIGAVAIELIRARGRTGADIALAVLFYGGIAAGVVLLSRSADGTAGNVNQYLFGAITTTTEGDLVAFAMLSAGVFTVTLGLGRYLFAVSNDEEYAIATGLPVVGLNVVLAVVTAVTVVVSMRVVGLLLISALMIVPVASAQALARSFRSTLVLAVVVGVVAAVAGVVISYYQDTPSGGTIVLVAIAVFGTAVLAGRVQGAVPARVG